MKFDEHENIKTLMNITMKHLEQFKHYHSFHNCDDHGYHVVVKQYIKPTQFICENMVIIIVHIHMRIYIYNII